MSVSLRIPRMLASLSIPFGICREGGPAVRGRQRALRGNGRDAASCRGMPWIAAPCGMPKKAFPSAGGLNYPSATMPDLTPPGSSPQGAEPQGERLDSWKEIAAYLRRDVTTVQRWEKREGMPVHRHLHDKVGSVYAFRAELEAWARSRSIAVGGLDRFEPPAAGDAEPETTRGSGRRDGRPRGKARSWMRDSPG